ncbi:hypothetical protein [Mesorhizobium loti]|uniref:Uncharacterized protein n=1 Tax=Mesorhizobium loti R88b TaxID=935548 RepID=A0A6M7WND2_RHILI|nr:hypothetical protein [Mesorhizobium loti]QKD03495.1 hypothetical protein EB235_20000 [Mesorhizobium loti R88b]
MARTASTAVVAPTVAEAAKADTALERARYHFDQFAAAMDELTTGYDGWKIGGAGHSREFAAAGCRTIGDYSWLSARLVQYETGTEPRCPALIVERHHEFIGMQKQPRGWLDEPLYRDGEGVRLSAPSINRPSDT